MLLLAFRSRTLANPHATRYAHTTHTSHTQYTRTLSGTAIACMNLCSRYFAGCGDSRVPRNLCRSEGAHAARGPSALPLPSKLTSVPVSLSLSRAHTHILCFSVSHTYTSSRHRFTLLLLRALSLPSSSHSCCRLQVDSGRTRH